MKLVYQLKLHNNRFVVGNVHYNLHGFLLFFFCFSAFFLFIIFVDLKQKERKMQKELLAILYDGW